MAALMMRRIVSEPSLASRRPGACLFIFILLTLTVPVFAGTEMARVLRVVDGRTVIVRLKEQEKTVRLLGLITPSGHDVRTLRLSELSKEFLTQLLTNGWVYLELDSAVPSPDKESRVIAYAYRQDGLFVNERMIAEGFAVLDARMKFLYADRFREAQVKAAKSDRGLWGRADSQAANWGSQTVSGQPIALDDSAKAPKVEDARKVKSKAKTRISIGN